MNKMRVCVLTVLAGFLAISLYAEPKSVGSARAEKCNKAAISVAELESRIRKILPLVVDFRHQLHQIPELGGEEKKTSAAIREKLAPLGLDVQAPFVGTDVVALLNKEKKGNLTLRADMDGLPVEEADRNCPYRSQHPGRMHACGHDGHMAMLYGAALVLSQLKDEVPTSVRFLFQPGEEFRHMAQDVLAKGALLNPEPDFIIGIHNWPHVPFGAICTKPGILMAATVHFKIVLHGKSGHGSLPHLANNPIDCAADILVESRAIIPPDCVLSFCQCASGTNTNNIPDDAILQGTMRFLDFETGRKLIADFESVVSRITSRRKVRYEFTAPLGYAPVINRPEDFEKVQNILSKNLPANGFYKLPAHVMSGEDFSWYLQKYHGIFVQLGNGETTPSLHATQYDFNDETLFYGIRFFCLMALNGDKLL